MIRNTTQSMIHRGGLFLAALAALALTACATTPGGDDKQVVKRAQERWDAIVEDRLEAAYEYYSPGYRSATSLINFGTEMRLRKVRYISAEYLDHQCEQSRCTVRFMVGYRVFAPVPGLRQYDGKQVVEDTWVRTSGEWWYLPDK